MQDPNDQCCQMARCDAFATPSPKPINTPTPGVVTTQKPLIVTPNQNTGPTGTVKPPFVTHSTVTGRAGMDVICCCVMFYCKINYETK